MDFAHVAAGWQGKAVAMTLHWGAVMVTGWHGVGVGCGLC